MNEIDQMDMLGFIRLRAWEARREYDAKHTVIYKKAYIDEVWPSNDSI